MKFLFKLEKIFFYLLVFFLPLQWRLILGSFNSPFNEWASIYLYATDILIAATLILWAWRLFTAKNSGQSAEVNLRAELYQAAFFVISALSLAVAGNLKLGVYSLMKIFEFIALYLYLKFNFQKLFSLENFWRVFVVSALLQSALAVAQFFKQKWLGLKILSESPLAPDIDGVAKVVVNGQKFIRAYGLTPHPNILAAVLVAAIFGLVYLFLKKYRRIDNVRKIIYGFVFALLLFALCLTFSRAVTVIGLGLLFLWLILIFWRVRNLRRPVLIVFFALLVVGLSLSILFRAYLFARYDFGQFGAGQSVNLRVFYNKIAWDIIKQIPLFGVGVGNFVWATSRLPLLPAWLYQPVHNIYLLIAAQSGVFALLAFLIFLFIIIAKSLKKAKTSIGGDGLAVSCLLFVVFCLLLIGLFDHFLWDQQQGQILLWTILGTLSSFI